jgi:hypothetical protein
MRNARRLLGVRAYRVADNIRRWIEDQVASRPRSIAELLSGGQETVSEYDVLRLCLEGVLFLDLDQPLTAETFVMPRVRL